ncbi:unnamed protein product, partial [Gulo gulo]
MKPDIHTFSCLAPWVLEIVLWNFARVSATFSPCIGWKCIWFDCISILPRVFNLLYVTCIWSSGNCI